MSNHPSNDNGFSRGIIHDAATVDLTLADAVSTDDGSIDWDDVPRVTVDGDHWESFFGTDEFFVFEDATVARPIEQEYTVRDERVTMKKPAEEIQRAAWQLHNAFYTVGHPDSTSGIVEDMDDVRGFTRDPERVVHDGEPDEQTVDVYLPTNDDELRSFVDTHPSVSVGGKTKFDWQTDEEGIDAYQRDIRFDHVAGVSQGRCSTEDGCSLYDSSPAVSEDTLSGPDHTGGVVIPLSDSQHSYSVGDWVTWEDGAAHGKVDEVLTEGCTSRGKGDMEVCAEDGDPAVVVEVYDDETGESKDEMVRHKMSTLNSWSGPEDMSDVDNNNGGCSPGPCSCGNHTDSDGGDTVLTVVDKSVAGVTFEGTATGDLDKSEIPNDDYEQHYLFPADTKSESSYPVVDAEGMLRRGNVEAAYGLGARGGVSESELHSKLEALNGEFDDEPIDPDNFSDSTMTDDDPSNGGTDNGGSVFGLSDMSVEAVAQEHDGVSDLQDTISEKEQTIERKDERIGTLEDRVEDLRSDVLDEKKADFDDAVETLTDATSHWDEDELRAEWGADDEETFTVSDAEDAIASIEDKISMVSDLADELADGDTDPTTIGDGSGGGNGSGSGDGDGSTNGGDPPTASSGPEFLPNTA